MIASTPHLRTLRPAAALTASLDAGASLPVPSGLRRASIIPIYSRAAGQATGTPEIHPYALIGAVAATAPDVAQVQTPIGAYGARTEGSATVSQPIKELVASFANPGADGAHTYPAIDVELPFGTTAVGAQSLDTDAAHLGVLTLLLAWEQ